MARESDFAGVLAFSEKAGGQGGTEMGAGGLLRAHGLLLGYLQEVGLS